MNKVFRPRLSEIEIRWLRNLFEEKLRCDRYNLLCEKRRIVGGGQDIQVYSLSEQERNYKRGLRLLRKLDRLLGQKVRIYPAYRQKRGA